MTSLQRRLKKLEGVLNDPLGFIPHSEKWLEHWDRQYYLYLTAGEPLVLVRTLSARCFTAISALDDDSCRKCRVPARFRCLRRRFAGRRGRRCRRSRVESANSLRCRRQAAPLFNSFAGPL